MTELNIDSGYFKVLLEKHIPDFYRIVLLDDLSYLEEKQKVLWQDTEKKKLVFIAGGLSQFLDYSKYAPKTGRYYQEIRFFRDSFTKNAIEISNTASVPIESQVANDFADIYIKYVLSSENTNITEDQFWILMASIPTDLNDSEKQILQGEFMKVVVYYSIYLEAINNTKQENINETTISKFLIGYKSYINNRLPKELNMEVMWKPITEVLCAGKEKHEELKEIFEKYKKDSSEHKVENIKEITQIAKALCQSRNYSQPFMMGFAYTIKQLNEYSENDENAISTLSELKGLFIDYSAELKKQYKKEGDEMDVASVLLNHLGEKILLNDDDLRMQLKYLWSYESQESDRRCFIATKCYGNYNSSEVLILREYRDEIISNYAVGRIFISIYYFLSPALVKTIFRIPVASRIFKILFLTPIINAIKSKRSINDIS